MLDIRLIREKPELVKQAAIDKGDRADVDRILELDAARRETSQKLDEQKRVRKESSKRIGAMMKAGEDPEELKEEVRLLGDEVKAGDVRLRELETELRGLLLRVPNIPHESAPRGSEENNRLERTVGEQRQFDFKPRQHDELGAQHEMFDFERGAKITGSHWPVLRGIGARLERALINFMLDFHIEQHAMTEIMPPFAVNRKTITGTGQLPKLEDDMYRCDVDDLFLIPTAEVPVTGLFADEMLSGSDLPIYYCAYTPCFRREAGSYGKETRGLTRVHQFDKVEMVKFVLPETSWDELETLLNCAEDILKALGLHYRIVTLATGDLSFAAAKCYDIEVWAPGQEKYLECSSCSNFEDFQARRSNIRFKRDAKSKPEFVHTLNASGLALPRTVIALMETYQQADGSILIPEALQPYFGREKIG